MKKKFIKYVLSISIIFLIFFEYNYANAQSAQEKKTEAENNKNQATKELNQINDQKDEAQDQVEELRSQIDDLNSSIDDLNSQITELNNSITEKQSQISEKEKDIQSKQDLLTERLVAMYKKGTYSYLDILLGSGSYIDMISTYGVVKDIAEADTNLINEVTEQKQAIENEKQELENNKNEVSSKKEEVESKKQDVNAKKAEKDKMVASLSEDAKQKQAEIDEFDAQIKQAEKQIQSEAAEAQRKAQQRLQEQAKNNSSKSSGSSNTSSKGGTYNNSSGTLGMPLSSYSYISSFFGPRTRPTAGASTNHGALDFAASSGLPVYASEAGVVLLARRYGGYGNYIMIWHNGKGSLYTGYGHLSSFSVSEGQTVSRGQQIGTVGSTGVSTGPHLHFEVYSGGTSHSNRVDPLNYLPI